MDVHEYKGLRYKRVTLPSGLEIKTREMSPYVAMRIQANSSNPENFMDANIIEELFKTFVVDPKIPDEIKVEEFLSADYNAIYWKILDQIIPKRGAEITDTIDKNKDFST